MTLSRGERPRRVAKGICLGILSEAKKPLGSNTEQSSPYGPLNALETTQTKGLSVRKQQKKVGQKAPN
ncbi:MAG: hypothetical protein JKY01_04545 [Pseudomonadales bacterium]|nr:hypothetical protein [Pseudomonadales bacterium]